MSLRFHTWIAACVLVFAGGAHGVGVPGQGTWETTLQPRDINVDGIVDAYYDTALDIAWLADWRATGPLDWDDAMAWAARLNVHGATGWRLPTMTDVGNDGCASGPDCGEGAQLDSRTSEFVHMYYVTLGNWSRSQGPGWGLSNSGPFRNMQSVDYWIDQAYAPDASFAWHFYAYFGSQGPFEKRSGERGFDFFSVAVHPGDVEITGIPEPRTYLLMAVGLGLLSLARHHRRSRAAL